MNKKELVALIKKEANNAHLTVVRAEKKEEAWDYSDTTFTIERAYAEGYAEALYFLLNRIDDETWEREKKKNKTKKKGKKK